jgi:hypothetical protein
MVATAHALVGGAIAAASVSNPGLALVASAVSHPLMDLIPHWDFGYNWKEKSKTKLFIESVLDLGVGFVLAYLLFGQNLNFWYFTAVIFAAEFWDMMETPYWFLKWNFPPFSTIYNVQSRMQNKQALPWGVVTQVVVVLAVIWIIGIFR